MDPFKNQDYIDAYLKGELSAEKVRVFEQKMAEDPFLRNEVKYQEDLVNALSKKRKMMLKARLDNVPVGTFAGLGMQKLLSWVASVGSVILISGGAWYFMSDESPDQVNRFNITPENTVVSSQEKTLPPMPEPEKDSLKTSDKEAKEPVQETAPEEKAPKNTDRASTVTKLESNKPSSGQKTNALPQVKPPEVMSSFEEDFLNQDTDKLEVPNKDLVSDKFLESNNLQISTIEKEPYNFHYQYYNDQLYLYGDFKDIPYEILALNKENSNKLRLFLAYEGNFYAIQHGQKEVAPLRKIQDPQLIEELEVVKNHK